MPKDKTEESIMDGHEWWHGNCGGFAGDNRAEVVEHLQTCTEGGRTVHSHERDEGGSGHTITITFHKEALAK
jgi:hypothetical protein